MARKHSAVLTVRVRPETRAAILAFGRDRELIDESSGRVNVSQTLRMLARKGLEGEDNDYDE